ncbi:hypothetical protein L1987_03006 [Smallanthus sonchifolius]|uniref:Uncharacterized protein n=1 Tax=Smallanthus sonchifolius TaxID=185202 RepID=A0ACB9K9K8_9ASTR|nr:hypothetical protein L1987_03006 [Smallanthus sonchifolius]
MSNKSSISSSSSSSAVGLKDVIYKLQLRLLEGIRSESQLSVAGSLLSKSDYHDVVTERSIAQMCGYPLCLNSLPLSKKGRYRISLKEHKVYDLLETHMYCSTKCLVDSRAYEESLQDERSLDFDTGKIDKVVRLFEGLNLKTEEGLGDFGLGNLSIKEKKDESVVMSMEEWIGPSNAIEGYVPHHHHTSKNKPVKDGKLKTGEKEERMFDELNFTSSIITQGDGYNISKKPCGQTKMKKKHTRLSDEEESEIHEPSGLKSCSGASAAAIRRNVTWADDETDSNNQTHVSENEKGFAILEDQLASAEAEAQFVDSGDVVPVSEAGLLPPLEGAIDPEPAQWKWSKKTGIVESDFLDSEDYWFDAPPEEFVADLSPFPTMFMSLFAWVSSSTLAYVYGGEDEEHYASINGREYPQKSVSADGRSSEIKQTLASCLARALPGLVLHLRLATPVSSIEYGMGCLLETMSFLYPLPALRMKQWHVFLLLFLEALSLYRVPALAPQLSNTASFFHKVFEDGRISREEYEVLKDLILPLGRVPQFAMQSGAYIQHFVCFPGYRGQCPG